MSATLCDTPLPAFLRRPIDRKARAALSAQSSTDFALPVGEAALAACNEINSITFELPNLHRIPFNLDPFDLKFENDIYVATDEPYGMIKGTITRSK